MLEFIHSPGDLLANVFYPGASPKKLTLLTGPRGSGKTTWCLALHQEAILKGIQTQGLISTPIIDDNQKIGIALIELSKNACRPLAVRHRNKDERPQTRAWKFNVDSLQWGNKTLCQIDKSQLLIIDELGPLEFHSHEGWQAAFPLIARREYQWAVVVIRPTLLPLAQRRWPWAEVWDANKGGQ